MKPTRGVLILVAVFISLLAVPCAIWISDGAAVSRRSLFLTDPPNHMEYVVRWQLVGPFADRSNGSDDEIVAGEVTKDYLRSWDGSEETITMQHAAELCMLKHRCRSYESAGSLVPLYQLFPEDQSSAVYAIGTVTCSHAMAVVLDVNVVPGAVWLNGQRVLRFAATEHGGTGLQTRRLLPVQLKAGVNDLMIKTIGELTQQRDWMLSVGIVSEKESGNIWLERRSGNLLERHLVTAAEAIEIVQPGIPVGAPVHVSLVDINGAVKYEASSTAWPRSVPTNALPEGYYRITLSVGESYATDEVFVGDVAKQISLLMTEPPTTTTPSQRPVQLDSLLQRYKILTSPQYVHPEENSWQRKMVLVARNAVLANQMKDGDAAWTKLPGFHLREYISRSDGSRQPRADPRDVERAKLRSAYLRYTAELTGKGIITHNQQLAIEANIGAKLRSPDYKDIPEAETLSAAIVFDLWCAAGDSCETTVAVGGMGGAIMIPRDRRHELVVSRLALLSERGVVRGRDRRLCLDLWTAMDNFQLQVVTETAAESNKR